MILGNLSGKVARPLAESSLCFALVALATGSPALACQYEFAPEPIGGPSAQFIARKMAAEATFVDIAVAEGESDIRGPDGKVSPWSKGLSFRILDRWKGASADRFLLFGRIVPESEPANSWALAHWVDEQGRLYPHEGIREATIIPPQGMTSCDPPSLTVKRGHSYVILREADGRLLRAVEFHPGMTRVGPALAEVGLWPESDWARQLSYTRSAPPESARQQVRAADPARATLRFRRPLPPAAVNDLLRRAGVSPFAARLVRDGVTMDYQLDSGLAWPGLVDDAAAWAARSATDRAIVEGQAKAVIDAYPLRDIANDAAKLTLARSVLALATAPAEQGPALIAEVAVIADGAGQRALANHKDIAEVVPAQTVRGRVSRRTGAASSVSLPQVEPLALHRRLTAIAGRAIDAAALQGRWRMTGGDATIFDEKVFVLELGSGRVTATLPCASATGTYRFEGQVLELGLPKPSLASCPQRQSYWYPGYLFDLTNKQLTARLDGDRLDLIAETGTFHFAREPSGN